MCETTMEKRVAKVKAWLREGYSRIEAVELLAEEDNIKFNTAKVIVYTAFPGSKYSQRRRRWKKKPIVEPMAPPPEIMVDTDEDEDL